MKCGSCGPADIHGAVGDVSAEMQVRVALAPRLLITATTETESSTALVMARGDPTQVMNPVEREGDLSVSCPLREESENQAALRRRKGPKQSPSELPRPHSVRLHGEAAPPCAPRTGVRFLEGKCTPTRGLQCCKRVQEAQHVHTIWLLHNLRELQPQEDVRHAY